MKFSYVCLILLTMSIFSCGSNEGSCPEKILGTYEGYCTYNANLYEGELVISLSSDNEQEVIIKDESLNDGERLIIGTVLEDCGRVTIPVQALNTNTSNGFTLFGYYDIDDDDKLTGQITITGLTGDSAVCDYNMEKK